MMLKEGFCHGNALDGLVPRRIWGSVRGSRVWSGDALGAIGIHLRSPSFRWSRRLPRPAFSRTVLPVPPAVSPVQVPIEVLLLQIENHVRLEQAAAESFLAFPTQALLHSKTTSPFVN